MKSNKVNRFIAVVLSALLILSVMPLSVLADSDLSDTPFEPAKGLIIDDSTELTIDPLLSGSFYGLNSELPDSFDISTSDEYKDYLPPVRDQGAVGSCAAFASTYYTFTYEMAKLKSWDASLPEHQFSAMWAFRNVDKGENNGSNYRLIFDFLKYCGAVTEKDMPTPTSWCDEYATWCTNKELIKEALQYRVKDWNQYTWLSTEDNENESETHMFNGVDDKDLLAVKTRIANGYVVPVACQKFNLDYMDGQRIIGENNESIGKVAVANYWKDGDAHAVTIVGYDDNIVCDMNGNNTIEPNEMGAFKILNSWGKGGTWQNGFDWIMYDALNYDIDYMLTKSEYNFHEKYKRLPVFSTSSYDEDGKFHQGEYYYYTIEVTDDVPDAYIEMTIPPITANGNPSFVVQLYNEEGERCHQNAFSYNNKSQPVQHTMLFDVSSFMYEFNTDLNFYNFDWVIRTRFGGTDNDVKIKNYDKSSSVENDIIIDSGCTTMIDDSYYQTDRLSFDMREKENANNNFTYAPDNKQIIMSNAGVTLEDIQNGLYGGRYRAYEPDGTEIGSYQRLGTGYTVKQTCGAEVLDELQVILYGDVNGDALVDFRDYYRLYDHVYDGQALEQPYFQAGIYRRVIDPEYNALQPTTEDPKALKEYLESDDTSIAVFPDGTYNLRCLKNTELMMEAYGFGYENGTIVHLNYYTNNNNQR